MINIGIDMSNNNSQYNYFNTNGSWQQSSMPGSIMIRPVVGKGYYIGVKENPETSGVCLYPNPTSSLLHIEGVTQGQSIALYDITGRKVLQTTFTPELSVEGLCPGLYLISITTTEGIINRKINVKP